MPGPVPKPPEQRRRRNAPMANTLRLPAEGRPGDAPSWPLSGSAPALWDELWATPQAVAWERLGWTRVVARYTNATLAAERVDAPVALMAEVRQLEDRLGLTPMAMLRLRWEVTADELDEKRQESKPKRVERRLKIAGS